MHLTSTTLDESLRDALAWLLRHGVRVSSRGGETLESLMVSLEITQPWHREITLPDRKASLPAQIYETCWMLAGRNDIAALERYLPRARDFSDDGETWRAAYGPRIKSQIPYIVRTLTEDPSSRQAVISIYDPAVDSTSVKVKDRACNLALQFIIREGELHCNVFLRSNDAIWGYSGINVFAWSTLQEIIAGVLGVQIGNLQFNTTSFHLYERHLNRAKKIVKAPLPSSDQFIRSPRFQAGALGSIHQLGELLSLWFEAEELIRENPGEFVRLRETIAVFPEPMLRSWLQVLAYHWSADERHLNGLEDTRLRRAATLSPKLKKTPVPQRSNPMGTFVSEVIDLHNRKHAAYGDSWKRRGEVLGILANVDRKIDRLDADDETESGVDTAIDLFVYAAKWANWLKNPNDEGAANTNLLIDRYGGRAILVLVAQSELIRQIRMVGGRLDALVPDGSPHEVDVHLLLELSGRLAQIRWSAVNGDDYAGADRD